MGSGPTDKEIARQVLALVKEQAAEGFTPEGEDDSGLDQVSTMIEERQTKPGFLTELVRQAADAGITINAQDVASAFIDAARLRH
jgi:hypothetical protein